MARGGTSALGIGASGTLQGEGILVGVPSLFVRLGGCNLRCLFRGPDGRESCCDTPHAQRAAEGRAQTVEEVVNLVVENLGELRHVVVTGGEPMLQAEAVAELCEELAREKPGLHITLETNGTIYNPLVARAVQLVSVSPKRQRETFAEGLPTQAYLSALQQWIDAKRGEHGALQLKFVVGRAEDETELIDAVLSGLRGAEEFAVVVMPLGGDVDTLRRSEPLAVEMAIRRGWRYSPRLQVDIWGGRRGA